MKLLKLTMSLFVVLFISFTTISCSGKKTEGVSKNTEVKSDGHDQEHKEVATENQDRSERKMDNSNELKQNSGKSTLILASYFQLKNALASDDSKEAAIAAKVLFKLLKGFDASEFSEKDQKEIAEIMDDASENAEHISDSPIQHQREHFVMLSEDIIDLVTITGSEKTIYQDYCPMANDKKGAVWLSEVKEIKNPFMGSKMPTCGSVQKEL